jgi:hypothetical protein
MDAALSLGGRAAQPLKWRPTRLELTIGLTLLALTVRLIGFDTRPLWLDEAYSAWFSGRGWHELWTEVPTYEPHPPFYYSLLKLWRLLFGGSAIGLRSLSLVLALATVPLITAASGELERQRPTGHPLLSAGVAGFIAGASPMLVLLGQEARPYPLLIFAYALATLSVLRLIRELADGPGTWSSWLMLAAGTELGLWAHGLGLIYAACLAAAVAPLWLKGRDRARLLRGGAAAALILLLYLPCLLMILNRAGDWGSSGWLTWSPIMALQLLSLYAVPVEVLTISTAVASLVMLLLAKRAVQFGLETPGWGAERALVLLWWGPPLIAIVVSELAMPVFLIRTLAPTLVPAVVAIAAALARSDSGRERLALGAALVITLIPGSLQIATRPATEPWDEVAVYLNHNVRSGDQVWLYPNDSALPLKEAGASIPTRGIPGNYPAIGVRGPIRAGSPAVKSVAADQAAAFAGDRNIGNVPTVWLVTRQSGLFDPANAMPAALARGRRPGSMQEWGYINVRPYYRR